ncbi:MAG: TRAP transporter substrate-binding protein DctP [Alphaproteobacteria bacterium]|nr:TRAP transporter substrate-binding protein DctP [Alphaproteobacteria bacterium]
MKKLFAAALGLAVLVGTPVAGQAEPIKFKLALSTGPNHVRNISLEGFISKLKERTEGELEVEVFPANQLFKGPDIPKALAQGTLEMGVPGLWQMGKFEPNALIPDLPIFYGATRAQIYSVWDGPLGDEMKDRLEKKLRVKIVGDFMDLGYGTIFTTDKEIKSHADMAGMKFRTPPGAATVARYKVFGTNPVSIPFGDVPLALTQGTVDGLMTTHESSRSAKLWDSGVKFAYNDQQAFLQYVPMVSRVQWDKLTPAVRDIITNTWAETVGPARKLAEKRQADAQAEGTKNGVTTIEASPADLAAMRTKLLAAQDDIVKQLDMDPEFVARVAAALK